MKKYLVVSLMLAVLPAPAVQAEWTYLGDYVGPYKAEGNIVTFTCTNATVTVEVCTEDILRIRMSKSGRFKPNEPWVVIKYDWPKSNFTVNDRGDYIDISTQSITVKAYKSPFRLDIYDEDTRALCLEPNAGSMGFDEEKVICRKKLTETDHFFGLGQRYEKSDLRGEKRELWVTENVTWIPFFMATDGYGIFFHNTWKTTFDFTQDPYYFSSPGGGELDYYFIYGPSFKHILNQYTRITGKSPLPPKWAFGMIASKWSLQKGQQGILDDVTAARTEKDWPIDCIRVHAKNCSQGIWASPNLSWPDDGWGSFDAVDQLVKKLHEMNCHAIFWENPGIPQTCTEKYEDADSQGFFITQDGATWNGRFGYGMDPGALVDFCNPESRKWWADLHNFMIDFDSDGAAGDHGEEVYGTMYSPYAKMSGEELHNLYSMLYDMASWQAYKARNPNKRCVVWGRSLWAGTQRYPMQGTQDSHSEGMNIEGEIMGCINFGLSGVPFRIYTDNVTREILDSRRTDWPLSRLSQYLCLTVAGERTELYWTGRETPDDNYRKFARLRYRLMPYIYTYARKTTQTGLPLVRAMVLEYQKDPNTYSAYGQYLLGEHLLIAPLWSDTTFSRQIYLPEGEWIDFWDGTKYEGRQTITYSVPIDKAPILVKAGAIIPMAPDGQSYLDQKKSPLTIRIHPKGRSSFALYEDDGVSYDYEKGVYASTLFRCMERTDGVLVTKRAPTGSYKIPDRDHVFAVHKKMKVNSVTNSGTPTPRYDSRAKLDSAAEGWFYDSSSHIIWAKIKGGANELISVAFLKDRTGP
ncbi:MAG: glycoside hydrolase family 31 protein [Planctomycetota bacterium]|jgi:alpha-glucosidase (family GH31 glycosyl hydrolase)